MQIAILLFNDITILDAVGPYEVLSRIPGATVNWVSPSPGPKKARGGLTLMAERRLDEVPAPQIVLVPGGSGVRGWSSHVWHGRIGRSDYRIEA